MAILYLCSKLICLVCQISLDSLLWINGGLPTIGMTKELAYDVLCAYILLKGPEPECFDLLRRFPGSVSLAL